MRTYTIPLAAALLCSACAMATVLSHPSAKDLSKLEAGTPRKELVLELGAPVHTAEVDGLRRDSFAFNKGISGGERFGRALLHVGADIVSLFLWEFIGWPSESVAKRELTKVDVVYDKDDKVRSVTKL